MKKHPSIWLRRVLSLVLAAVLLVPAVGQMAVVDASAVTQAEINALKSNANKLAGQKKELQNQLKDVRAKKADAQSQKDLLERQMNVIQSEIDNIAQQINQYQGLINEKAAELAETEAKEKAQYELFCKRIRVMEEEGQVSYWSILFSSDSFSDLLDNFMMVEEIIQYDNSVMDQLLALQAKIEAEKSELEDAKAQQEAARQQQVAAKQELASQQSEVDKLITQISATEADLQKQEAALRSAAAAADAEIRRKEKELASQIANVPSESGFLWPLSGYNTLSSLFGSRIHPITGKANNHTGIDIPAPRGTTIKAAKSGVVTKSTYNNSYGNYVVVSHSDGTSTLYAHMSRRSVSEGQKVSQGAKLGEVGTTGSSTGNHLHFEVRVKGSRTDPVNYFKSMTLYVTYRGQKKKL